MKRIALGMILGLAVAVSFGATVMYTADTTTYRGTTVITSPSGAGGTIVYNNTKFLADKGYQIEAASDPDVDDDAADTGGNGIAREGTRWRNTSTGVVYLSVDDSTGAAVWVPVAGALTSTVTDQDITLSPNGTGSVAVPAPLVVSDGTASYLTLGNTTDASTSSVFTMYGKTAAPASLEATWELGADGYLDLSTQGTNDVMTVAIAGGKVGFNQTAPATYQVEVGGTLGVSNDSGLAVGAGGDLQVSVSSDDVIFRQATQDKDILFYGNDGGVDTMMFKIDSSVGGRLYAGMGVTPYTAGVLSLAVNGVTGAGDIGIALLHTEDGNDASEIHFYKDKAGGSVTSTTELGTISFRGHDGTSYKSGAYIQASLDGTPGTDNLPTKLEFATRPDGAAGSATVRLTIDEAGDATFTGAITTIGETVSTTGDTNLTISSSDGNEPELKFDKNTDNDVKFQYDDTYDWLRVLSTTDNGSTWTAAPSVHIGDESYISHLRAGLAVNRNCTEGQTYYGFAACDQWNHTTAAKAYCSYDAIPFALGVRNVDHVMSFQARPQINVTGTVDNVYALGSMLEIGAGATATLIRHIYIQDPYGGGSVTTQHGLFITTLDEATTNYGITIGNTDVDHNLLHVGVTGDPLISWDESDNTFDCNMGWHITSGQIGIGTTPAAPIDIEANTVLLAMFQGTSQTYNRVCIDVANTADSQLSFMENASTKWSIGNNADDDAFHIRSGTGAFGTNTMLTLDTSGNITPTGKVKAGTGVVIGTDQDANLIDDATNGAASTTLYIGNETIDTSVSDVRLKEHIQPTSIDALAILEKLEVKDFDWKGGERKKRGRSTGLIAQDVAKVLPQVVRQGEREEDMKAVEYQHLVPYLIEAIKQQQAEIDELKSRLEAKGA